MVQSYEKTSEMQKENLFFFSFSSASNFLAKRKSYEKTSEKPKIKQKNPTLFLHFPHFFSTFVPRKIK